MANVSGVQASIGNGQTMNADAARYWSALVEAISEASGIAILATEGTRTYARQKHLYDGYRAGRVDPSTGRRFNPAWSPDSPYAYHLSGRAVDVGSGVGYVATAASREFYSRAGQYGFRPTVKGEPWHFEWRSDWVGVSLETASTDAKIIPPASVQEDDMYEELDRQRQINIENILVKDGDGGLRGRLERAEAKLDVLTNIVAKDTDDSGITGGLRGLLRDVRKNAYTAQASSGNVEKILAKDNGGGIRALLERVVKKTGA